MFPPAREFTPDHVAILRRLRGISQGDLALRLGMRQPDLSELERGRRSIPRDFEAKLWKALAE
jgi:transcriptional regulator with XRE-family HTH domain